MCVKNKLFFIETLTVFDRDPEQEKNKTVSPRDPNNYFTSRP